MAKYHIGENGPARCRALVRACPIGGDHFDNEGEAEREYDRQMREKFDVLTGQRRDLELERAALEVGFAIDRTDGAWVSNVSVEDLRAGDVLPDGRVVAAREGERGSTAESSRFSVQYMDQDSAYPPGFSYEHFPQGKETTSTYTGAALMGKVFRPTLSRWQDFTTRGNEIRNVPIRALRPGDHLGDGLTVEDVDDESSKDTNEIIVHFKIDWEAVPEEFADSTQSFKYFKPNDVVPSVFVVEPR